jgi:cytochrome c-type biogenesis protein CcmF
VTSPISRESLILINNILLMVTTATILLGTLYPLVMDALGLGKISVGAPYFNSVFVPLTAPLVLLLGTASVIRWKQDKIKRLLWILTPVLLISFVIGVLWPVFNMPHYSSVAIFGVTLGVWTFATAVVGVWSRTSGGNRWRRLRNTPSSFYGMTLAHVGVGVFAIGIALTSAFSVEKQVRMAPGDHQLIGGYDFRFDGVIDVRGPNYLAQRGVITVLKDGLPVSRLEPEKRTYQIQRNPMTEAGIEAGLMRDLYVSLGEPLDDGRSWGLRLYLKPFIRWIWLGALLIAIGGLIAGFDRRYRLPSGIRNRSPSTATTPSVGI